MYAQHFGLKKQIFATTVTGPDVFVGPQTAKAMAGFRKALAAQDAVVTVSGEVGTGKTTLVHRAIDAIGTRYKTIRVGRMKMDSSDVLESLLVVLGVQDRPTGTIQRFAALRKKFKELEDREVRVFVVVEDALRAGTETLAELEALTSADAGESEGASIVLMGDERLPKFMRDPQLGQMQQRVRQRHTILPLCVAEFRGYLNHSFRLAGGDFEAIFDTRSAALLHQLSNGIPRVANNLIESVLTAASEKGIDKIPTSLIASIASEEYGLSADDFDFSIAETGSPVTESAAEPDPEPVAQVEPAPGPKPVVKIVDAPEPQPFVDVAPEPVAGSVADVVPEPEPEGAAEQQPVIVFADDSEEPADDPDDVPHLIHDTLPNLAILAPAMASVDDQAPEKKPEPVAETAPEVEQESTADVIPELVPEPKTAAEPVPELVAEPEPAAEPVPELVAEPEPAAEPVPELVAEPEPAAESVPELVAEPEPAPEFVPELVSDTEPAPELMPELVSEPGPEAESVPELVSEPERVAETALESDVVPELVAADSSADDRVPEWDRDPTLAELKPDLEALEQAMAFAHGVPAETPADDQAESDDLLDSVGEKEDLPEIILDKVIETGIENMRPEDSDDVLAPEPDKKPDLELGRIAAEIANAKSLDDVDDKMAETLFGTEISMVTAQLLVNSVAEDSANDELQLEQEAQPEEAPVVTEVAQVTEEISLDSQSDGKNPGLDLSASQRLKTVRALNTELHPSLRKPEKPKRAGASAESADGHEPEPIEDQINTSITQTLKALKVPADLVEDEPEPQKKSGFFSRFRRS